MSFICLRKKANMLFFFFSFKMEEELYNHMEKTWKAESIAHSPRVKTRMSGVGPVFFPTFTISHFHMLVSLMTCERRQSFLPYSSLF